MLFLGWFKVLVYCPVFLLLVILLIPPLPSLSWCLGWCPRKGVCFPQDEPVGRYPTIHHHPKNKTTNPQRGGNAQDPHNEKPTLKAGSRWVDTPPYLPPPQEQNHQPHNRRGNTQDPHNEKPTSPRTGRGSLIISTAVNHA